jgi:hypothetical protein
MYLKVSPLRGLLRAPGQARRAERLVAHARLVKACQPHRGGRFYITRFAGLPRRAYGFASPLFFKMLSTNFRSLSVLKILNGR